MVTRGLLVACLAATACGRIGFARDVPSGDASRADTSVRDGPSGVGPPVFVQTAASNSGQALVNVTGFTNDVTAGNLIVAAYNYYPDTVSYTSLTDTQNNTFSLAGPFDGNSGRQYVFYAFANTTGPDTITVMIDNQPTAAGSIDRLVEYSNVAPSPYDTSAFMFGTDTSPDAARADIVTGATDEVILAIIVSGTVTVGTGYTTVNPFSGDLVEEKTASTAGPYPVTATADSNWQVTAVAFRGAGSQ